MIEPRTLSALRVLWMRLKGCGSAWAITGSLGMALQGMDVEVHDVDLQTSRDGAYEIESLLSDFVQDPVGLSASEHIRSYFGSFEINRVCVEVMGDLQKWVDGAWEEPVNVEKYRQWVVVGEMRVPVLSLEYECEAYRKLGRIERAEEIRRWVEERRGKGN